MRIYPEKIDTTAEGTDEVTYNHVLWLFKLNRKQISVIENLFSNLWSDEYWFGFNAHNARAEIQSWARKINAFTNSSNSATKTTRVR